MFSSQTLSGVTSTGSTTTGAAQTGPVDAKKHPSAAPPATAAGNGLRPSRAAAATSTMHQVHPTTDTKETETIYKSDPNLFEGDIVPDYATILKNYGPDEVAKLEEQGIVLAGKEKAIHTRQADVGKRWNNRVNGVVQIPYLLRGYSDESRDAIDNAVKELGDRSHVVNFVPRTSESDYLLVQPGSGCSSFIGKQGGQQVVSLADPICMRVGTIQHEFLHALGFNHEQSRPDRDRFVTINYENIQKGKEFNFGIAKLSNSLGSPYDYNSVMHYGSNFFAKPGAGKTIVAPQPIGQRNGADDEDILQVILLYQCASGPRTVSKYNANPCTADCPCWEGAPGQCDGDDSCQGDLVCSGNQCVRDDGSGGGGTGTLGSWYQPIRSAADPDICVDTYEGLTDNLTPVTYYPCDSTDTQMWYHDDETNYIRNGADSNKCLVGSGGSTAAWTPLMIHDCWSNDARFMFDRYTDGSIRPRITRRRCLSANTNDGSDAIEFAACTSNVETQQWIWYE
jgi:hypothetical protein